MLNIISWNVNGLRACTKKGFLDFFKEINADIFCVQETKLQPEQFTLDLKGYHIYLNSAIKKGYSGTGIFTKEKPITVNYGLSIPHHDEEGRVITLQYENFFLVNVYTPNSKHELLRLDYRMDWEDDFRNYISKLSQIKPVIICGDLNVAHKHIDLKNPKMNLKNPGFTQEERNKLTLLLESGFVDSYRLFYPNKEDAYTWWSYRTGVREKNIGWRIDYFLVSDIYSSNISSASIYPDIYGSDHCPIGINISF